MPNLSQLKWERMNNEKYPDMFAAVAAKFGVEPRKLLSHVLEYSLQW